jgi:hypothetical protein
MQRVALRRWGVGPARMIIVGGVCGLAWAAGLRGFMAVIAGSASGVEWAGTFGWILLPGVVVGGLLGWAEHLRTTGGRRGWRWLALAPLLFASVVFRAPGALLEDGIGGGAIAVALLGMAAGYALSGRGPTWGRAISGVIALAPAPIWVLSSVGDPLLAVTSPRGAWLAVSFFSFLTVLGLGCSIPHRPLHLPDAAGALVMTRQGTRPATATPESQTVQPPV